MSIRSTISTEEVPMHRILAVVAMTALVPAGLVMCSPGIAGASVTLGGSTTCTSPAAGARVDFVHGLSSNPAIGDAIVAVTAKFTCTTGLVTPAVTSLTGLLKLTLMFEKVAPNRARKCSKFEGASPVDTVAVGSSGQVQWLAYNGTSNLGAVPSGLHYTGTYNADSSGSLSVDLTPTNATVGGSFAGALADLTLVLAPTVYNVCPVAPGWIVASSGTLNI